MVKTSENIMNRTYLYGLVFLLSFTKGYTQGCVMDTEFIIQTESSTNILLNLENLLNEDLGIDQGICGIRLVFDHDQLENLRITLTSPAGQSVTLIGPGTVTADFTDLISWNIAFTQCTSPAVPDTGFTDQWNSDQNWQNFETYMGTYFPFQGCLEDFNLGSANGTWELTIENLGISAGTLYYFELILCNDTGNDCNTCFLDVGNFDENYAIFCHEDGGLADISNLIEIQSVINTEQSLNYILSQNNEILQIDEQLTELDLLPPGIYEICALAYNLKDSSLVSTIDSVSHIRQLIADKIICADMSDFCLTIEILAPTDVIFIDTMFCFGDTLLLRDLVITNSIDTQFTVFDTLSNQPFTITCDSIIHLNAVAVEIDAVLSTNQNFVHCGQSVFLNAAASTASVFPINDFDWTSTGGNFINDIGPIAEVDQAGSYQIVVSNDLCSDSIILDLEAVDTFDLEISYVPVNCASDTIQALVTSSIAIDSILISGPDRIDEHDLGFSTVNDGIYYVSVYFGNCLEFDSIEIIKEAAELEIEVSANIITCDFPVSSIEYMTNALNPEITFMGPEMIPDNTNTPIVSTAGTYTIVITDETGCSLSEIIEVEIDTIAPKIIAGDIIRFCSNPEVELPLQITSPYNNLIWRGPSAFSSTVQNPMVSQEGIYSVKVYGENGCLDSTEILLTIENQEFPVEVHGYPLHCFNGVTSVCMTEPIGLDLSWSKDDIELSTEECFHGITEAGVYDLIVYDNNGCYTDTFVVIQDLTEELNLEILASASALDCINEEIDLQALTSSLSSDITFTWTFENEDISTDDEITISEPGIYTLTAFDSISFCGDRTDLMIEIHSDDIAGIDLMVEQPLCQGDLGNIIFEQIPDDLILDLFVNGQLIQFTEELTGLTPGEYQIEVLSEQGCRFDSTVVIDEGNIVFVNLGEDISGNIGDEVELNVDLSHPLDQLSAYQWSDPDILSCLDCINPTVSLLDNMVLSLEIVDNEGCRDVDELNILVDKNIDIFVPNAFTPNFDGDNDILTLYISDGIVKIFDIRISDRWGNLVFFHPEITKEVNNFSWDGTVNGENLVSGVYVFMAKLLLIDNSETIIIEDITLLR